MLWTLACMVRSLIGFLAGHWLLTMGRAVAMVPI